MKKKEQLTEDEQVDLKNALEHIDHLDHLMKRRPVEVFKTLLKMNVPMELEIGIGEGSYIVRFNGSE